MEHQAIDVAGGRANSVVGVAGGSVARPGQSRRENAAAAPARYHRHRTFDAAFDVGRLQPPAVALVLPVANAGGQ
jgi:hypothetical protein